MSNPAEEIFDNDPTDEEEPPFFPMADPDSIEQDNGNVVEPEDDQMPDAD